MRCNFEQDQCEPNVEVLRLIWLEFQMAWKPLKTRQVLNSNIIVFFMMMISPGWRTIWDWGQKLLLNVHDCWILHNANATVMVVATGLRKITVAQHGRTSKCHKRRRRESDGVDYGLFSSSPTLRKLHFKWAQRVRTSYTTLCCARPVTAERGRITGGRLSHQSRN